MVKCSEFFTIFEMKQRPQNPCAMQKFHWLSQSKEPEPDDQLIHFLKKISNLLTFL